MRTQVGIVGAGPAGLTLSLLLAARGIESVVLESRSRAHVEGRIRAGLLEPGTVDVLTRLGVAERLRREGLDHDRIELRFDGRAVEVPLTELTGRRMTVYGQQEIVKDLVAARIERGGALLFDAPVTALTGLDGDTAAIRFSHEGRERELTCDLVAGCDGFHGVSREAVPPGALNASERVYPFGWLGILARARPSTEHLIYAWHERGFALYSMRSPEVSRLYLQVPADEPLGDWPDERIWEELQTRLAAPGWRVAEGEIFDRSITPLRSFACEPLRHGRLLLAGDAAHIVPPTGAKGLNLAVNDVRLMADAIADLYETGSEAGLEAYSGLAMDRVRATQEFSHRMTELLHDLGGGPERRAAQLEELGRLARSPEALRELAEGYVGPAAAPPAEVPGADSLHLSPVPCHANEGSRR